MPRPTDTRERILAAARELFAQRGAQQTSLRDIADKLGLTKPALYYHFDSREALLASIVEPLLVDMDAFIRAREPGPLDTRTLLGDYFDLLHRHRDLISMLVRDLATLGLLDLGTRMIEWRRRLMALLLGPAPTLAAQIRAVVAIGGMSDCTVEFPDVPMDRIKPTAVDTAFIALGLPAAARPPRRAATPEPARRRAKKR